MTGPSFGSDDLAQFKQTFFDECSELLADLDERLTLLQDETADSEALNAIFRAVHSIKAGAGAFGFSRLVAFTHRYEALLDHLRGGAIQQTDQVVTVLIRAGDVLAALVDAAKTGEEASEGFGADVAADLDSLLAGISGGTASEAGPDPEEALSDDPDKPAEAAFRIGFTPHKELFRHANEPLLLIRELKRLGKTEVECDTSRLPGLRALEPEDAYFSFVIHVTTDRPESEVREVFEFVEDDCDLTIEKITAVPKGPETQGASHDLHVTEQMAGAALACEENGRAASPPVQAAPSELEPVSAPAQRMPAAASKQVEQPVKRSPANTQAAGVSSIRVDLDRVDRLVNVVGELVITQSMLAQQSTETTNSGGFQAAQGQEEMARIIRELQECVMAIRMQPVKSVFARMPRLVREVSAKVGKQVRLVMEGEQTEVDKTVIEELADPLTHMIRNAIDHGIEDPELRQSRGKKALGTIKLSAKHAGGNILIQVTDNGGGINRDTLLKKALEKGIVAPDTKLSDEEIDDLIFAPGFSTASAVTDVSGRGVGMDVVRRNINKLGGRIIVQSAYGKGTRFTLTIPLTLAVLDGMLVAIGDEKYILPLASIVESFRPEREQVRALAGGGEVVSMRGEYIRLIHIHRLFNVPGAISEPCEGLVVVTETANGGKVGLMVDELIGQQQVVIKSIQENFDPVPGVSGATILGNGRVALILDIEQLKAMPVPAARPQAAGSEESQSQEGSGRPAPIAAPMTTADGIQVPATV